MAAAPIPAPQRAHPGKSAAASAAEERRRALPAPPAPGNQALLRRQRSPQEPAAQAGELEVQDEHDETETHAAGRAPPPRAAPPAAEAPPAPPLAAPPAPTPPPPPPGAGAGAGAGGAAVPTPLAAAVALARADEGEALPDALRVPLERAFARDLRAVRLHRGAGAEALLAGIGARAAALGRDIFLGPTALAEREGGGFRLAHEVAHAVQQDLAEGAGAAALGARGSAEEQAADDAAWLALAGLPVPRQPRAAPGILRRDEPEVRPGSGGSTPAPVASPAVIEAYIANPTPMRMSVTLDGLIFRPLDHGEVTFPDSKLTPTAAMLNVLAPNSPLPDTVRRYNRDPRFPGWIPSNPTTRRASYVRVSPAAVPTTLAILDSLIGAENVALSDRQREILLTAQALNPIPDELIGDIMDRVPPGTSAEVNGVLGGDADVIRTLAPMWWDLTQAYVRQWQAWKATPTPETRRAAADALERLINAFSPFSRLLEAIHDDPALQTLPEWQVLWPNQRNGEMRGTNLYVFRAAVEFVEFASSQPSSFLTLALTDAAARRSLLLGFVAMRGTRSTATSGDLATSSAPSIYNAPALDMRIDTYPPLLPPSFSMVLNSTTTFHAQIQFMRFNDSISHAFGGWFYEWDYIKVPGDDPSILMTTSVPPSEASRWDALSADLDRDLRYAREDLARFDIVQSMAMRLGAPGLGPETLVGFNLLADMIGSVATQSIAFTTARSNEYAITPSEPGLYIARCIAGPRLSDTPTVAQFRRQPSSAWMPFWALSPERLGRELLTEDAINRRQAEDRYLELYDMLSIATHTNQAELEAEMERLRVSLYGNSREILAFQRAELDAERIRLSNIPGTPQAQIDALARQIESLDIMLGMRADREGILRGRVLRLPSTLVLDTGGVISLLIEVAQHNPGRALWHVSDLTTPDSKPHRPVRGNGTLAPEYDNEDAILATLKALLEGDGSYGRGQLSVQFPPNLDRTDQTRGNLRTIRIAADHINIVLHGIESMTTLVSIAAVVAAPFTGGASLVIMLPVGIIGALPSAYRLMDRAQAGTLRNDLATWMAVVDIVGAALNLGEIAAGARAAAGVGTRVGLRWAVVENGLWIAGIGGNGLGMLLMTKGMLQQFENLRGLPPGVAAARSLEIIGQALVQLGIQAGAHLASAGRVNSAEAGLRSAGDTATTRAAPLRVDPSVDSTPPGPRPAGLTEPTPELAAAMPPNIDVPLYRDPSGTRVAGGTVRVHYSRNGTTGRVDAGSIRVVAGPDATPAAVAAHAETVLTLREYAGVLGALLDASEALRGALGGRVRPRPGSAEWEAHAEINKLRPIIEARMRELRSLPADDPRVTALGDDIVNLMDQIEFARAVAAGVISADPRGVIDARTPEQLRVDNLAAIRADSIMVVSESGGQWTARSADDVVAAGADPAPGDYIFMQNGRPVVRGVATRRGSAPARHRLVREGGQWYLVPVDYAGAPIRRPDSTEVTLTEPGRDFDSAVIRAAAASPHTASSFPELETALRDAGLPEESEVRPLLRSWGRLINRLEIVRSQSAGMGLPTAREIAIAAAEALDPAATDGVVIGARYADYRRVLRQHAVAAILGIPASSLPFDGRPLAADVTARPSADQMAIYHELVDGLPASATEAAQARFMPQSGDIGELWVQYRTIRTQLDAAHGGTGTIRSIKVDTRRLVHATATEMDGALRVDSQLEDGPPPGDYGLESKGGSSFDRPQAVRYSDNITANGGRVLIDDATSKTLDDGTIVTTPGTSLAGMIYLADNVANATTIRNNLDANSLHPNIFVLYIDLDGRLKVMPRAVHRAASAAARAAAATTAPPAGTPPAGDVAPGTGGETPP